MMVGFLFKSLVKPFYRQNAGLFAFLFFIMFLAIGRANQVGLIEYHLTLIKGMLSDWIFLILVTAIWCFYARKCAIFFTLTVQKPEFSYLLLLGQLGQRSTYLLVLFVQFFLYLPVLAYTGIILAVGYTHHWYLTTNFVLLFNLCVLFGFAYWYRHILQNPGNKTNSYRWKLFSPPSEGYYAGFLINFILTKCKFLFLSIKICSCAVLFFIFSNRPAEDQDLRMAFLAFSIVMLGHGILIYAVKEMEYSRLAFYQGLPVSLVHRFFQYLLFFFILFLPETITILSLTPANLPSGTSTLFVFFGFGILLLLHSILLVKFMRRVAYLKITTNIFLAIFFSVISRSFPWLLFPIYATSIYLFFRFYYRQDGQTG